VRLGHLHFEIKNAKKSQQIHDAGNIKDGTGDSALKTQLSFGEAAQNPLRISKA